MFTNPFLLPLSYIAGKIMERKGNNMDTNLEESKILFTAGDGTAENPFIISDREGLEAVSDNLSAHYKLGADIDLFGEMFTPIGTSSLYFRGSLDGDGHVLRGLKVSAAGYAGLFGKASYATFKNLKIEGAEIESTGSYAGILAGSINGGSLTGCSVSGTLVGTSLTGGYAGEASGNVKVQECRMEGSISASGYTGGFFGKVSGTVEAEKCLVSGNVSGYESVGGFAGWVPGKNGTLKECSVSGEIQGSSYIGGLIGKMEGYTAIENSYASGSVSASGRGGYAGGLVGYRTYGTLTNCYAACRVSGKSEGLMNNASHDTITASYYDSQQAGFGTTDNENKGKLTSALTCKEFFSGWDFENVWSIEEGESYPYLKWEGEEGKRKADTGEIMGGEGTEGNPYRIGTGGGLKSIMYELSGKYLMMNDIDLFGEMFTPIGTSSLYFRGSLDGDGHVLRGLKVSAAGYAGLFGKASYATFKNLKIEGAEIESMGSYAGILAGYISGGNVLRCNVQGNISGKSYVGGIAGYASGSNIIGCQISGELIGSSYTGGILGILTGNSGNLQECSWEGTVRGGANTGGLTGNLTSGAIFGCVARTDVEGTENVGGLAGELMGRVEDSYAVGKVTSKTGKNTIGGIAGYSKSSTIKNCYASCQMGDKGEGLAYVYSSTTIQNSFFDSDIAGKTSPASQARTTQQMFSMDTYAGWDMESIWEHKEGAYPLLRKIEFFKNQLFELQVYNRTWHSAIIRWEAISGVAEYELHFKGKVEKLSEPEVFIEDLFPDTDYELKIIAKLDDSIQVASQILKLRTRKISSIKGLHSTHKEEDSITLAWDQIADAKRYEVTYGENVILTDTNTCTLTELDKDVPYVISVRALLADGGELISSPIVEKIYELEPQTDYAREFLTKCEGQTWFIDEVENLLNQKGKSICTVSSKDDFTAIYALNLSGRGISGQIPSAIGELYQLRYLYLANNNLSGQLPKEIDTLAYLIGQDLSGNQFTE